MNMWIALGLAALALWLITDGPAWLHHRVNRSRKPAPQDDPAERGPAEFAELADDADDGPAARAVEARLAHDAHLYEPVEHEPVRQPLAIEAAPDDRPGGAA